jgi:8-oxo-dGTP diphosphatase
MSTASKNPSPGVAVDLVVFTVDADELRVVLIHMKRAPFAGRWALPGGHIQPDETVEQAAARELTEKTSLPDVYLEQLYTFSKLDRDPLERCISVAHMALVPPTASLRTTDKYKGIAWFAVDKPPSLAFDHAEILAYARRRLRDKLAYTNVAYSLLPASFSLGELQRLYEVILGDELDPRNFQRRVLQLGMVEATGRVRAGQAHRPARLYRFRSRKPHQIPVLG